ncbi:hypothetical protein B0H65DRAFT_420184, partial [Neurospora tetraspora]
LFIQVDGCSSPSKSHFIRLLFIKFKEIVTLNYLPDPVTRTTPTGIFTTNINRSTIYSLL